MILRRESCNPPARWRGSRCVGGALRVIIPRAVHPPTHDPRRRMITADLAKTLTTLLRELVDGPPGFAFMLNQGDAGLLRSLDKLSAEAASESVPGGATIAAHVDHVRYGLSLMNRWAGGEPDPFTGADWTASWKTTSVSD